MLTDKLNIVIARAPKYARHKRKAAAVPTRIVVGGSKVADMSEAEMQQRHDAADRLWQERAVRAAVRKILPAVIGTLSTLCLLALMGCAGTGPGGPRSGPGITYCCCAGPRCDMPPVPAALGWSSNS